MTTDGERLAKIETELTDLREEVRRLRDDRHQANNLLHALVGKVDTALTFMQAPAIQLPGFAMNKKTGAILAAIVTTLVGAVVAAMEAARGSGP